MRALIAVLALACLCEARPMVDVGAFVSHDLAPFIVGGTEAAVGEFPWQLSQQRRSTSGTWSHSCGASLLSATYALSAAHCVDGATVANLRVVAGLHDRTDESSAQASLVTSYKMHESYGTGTGTYPNDIAILTLTSAIAEQPSVPGAVAYAVLPADNTDQFVGDTGIISGWGRTSSSNTLPNVLQKASIGIIATSQCNTLMSAVSGASASDNHICLYDTANGIGSCNGDSGGPLNLVWKATGVTVVGGVTSWGISTSAGVCLQTYPSVYTRVSAYLEWIASNTP